MEEVRVVLDKAGEISPVITSEYVNVGGYQGLKKALESPGEIIDIIKASGLRGRGGAGFPAGLKLSFTANTPLIRSTSSATRMRASGNQQGQGHYGRVPRLLKEWLANIAVGADKGYIYLRAEYPYVAKT